MRFAEPAPGHWAEARGWHTNAALIGLGVAMFFLARQLISEYDHFTIGFSGVSGWSCIVFLVAIWLILTQPVNRATLPIILTVAVVCRLVTLFPEPFLSSDVYRYAWDGVVQHAHISPYRYVPGDKLLTFLREPNQDLFDNINRRDYAHTIYPPVAQMIFFLITWISPTVTFMKMAMVFFEGLTVWALLGLLRELGLRREQVLLYAWCPALIWEIAGSGHLDSAAMAFIALALLARFRKQAFLMGLFLGIAIMIKFYPLVLLPALWRRKGDAWRSPAVIAAVVLFGYACYASAGKLVFGFAAGYAKEEGLETGARYFLLDWVRTLPGMHNLPVAAFYVFSVAVFASLMIWSWRVACQPASAPAAFLAPATALATALMLLFSPHYAWYVIWLVPFFVLLPNLGLITYLLGFFYGYTTELADPGPKMFILNRYLYAATAAAFVIWLIFRKWPIHRMHFLQPARNQFQPGHRHDSRKAAQAS